MLLTITQNHDYFEFSRIGENGESWSLGTFSANLNNDAYTGIYDTHEIQFNNSRELERILTKYGQRLDEVDGLDIIPDL